MRMSFTKMQGAGNDFVVLDETQGRLNLSAAQYRFLADRHFGVGADQILSVRPSPAVGLDFEYVIHNADGGEVEHCGNGARCFVRYVIDKGLTVKTSVQVKVQRGQIELSMNADGRVTVNMGAPVLEPEHIPFNPVGLTAKGQKGCETWLLPLSDGSEAQVMVVSLGNPHAVQVVADIATAPVLSQGPLIEKHAAFPNRVNAGYMQIQSRSAVLLRVYERGAGETLACGTGACAAVVAGIQLGLLDSCVDVHTQGGILTIEWAGLAESPIYMTGPATFVFDGEIEIPDL
ncbi:diaminopimelate epimerase [Limnohabitans sp. Rim8]|uniref:diaminopimelate epimerase n=1 Tax=Limnohabitans sp. Rim8 TaxID=1100718 RepID=UPI00261CE085|nr:diaminopimelate epimerase [Limnohabitans sp. Rim8]